MGVALILFAFPTSWTWPFFAIFQNTETRDRTNYKPAFYLEGFKVQQQSDAKNDFYNPSFL